MAASRIDAVEGARNYLPMIAAIFAAILVLTAGPAAAVIPDPVPSSAVDPSRIKFVTTDAASSRCIGRPKTPMCGIETLIGCYEQVKNAGCVHHKDPRFKGSGLPIRVEYVVVKSGFVNRKRVRAALRAEGGWDTYRWLTYEAFQVRALTRDCPYSQSSCDGIDWMDSIYTVSPHKGLWTFSMYGVFFERDFFVD